MNVDREDAATAADLVEEIAVQVGRAAEIVRPMHGIREIENAYGCLLLAQGLLNRLGPMLAETDSVSGSAGQSPDTGRSCGNLSGETIDDLNRQLAGATAALRAFNEHFGERYADNDTDTENS